MADGATSHWVLDLWSKSHRDGKGQAEATQPGSQKQYDSGGMVEIGATLKDPNDTGMTAPITSLFNSPVWALKKPNASWRMTIYHHKLNQVALIAPAVPGAVA